MSFQLNRRRRGRGKFRFMNKGLSSGRNRIGKEEVMFLIFCLGPDSMKLIYCVNIAKYENFLSYDIVL